MLINSTSTIINETAPVEPIAPSGNATVVPIPEVPTEDVTVENKTYPVKKKKYYDEYDNYTYDEKDMYRKDYPVMDYYNWFDSFNWMAIGVPMRRSCGGCWDMDRG